MTTPTTITLQIDSFCKCGGCINKVKKALRRLGDVILLAMNPEIGQFTLLTSKHPQVIEIALKKPFPKKNIRFSQQTNHSYPLHVSRVDDNGTTLVTMSQVQGLESMEFTQSNTFKFNFINHRHNHPTLSGLPPTIHNLPGSRGVHAPAAPPPKTYTTPSAPPIPKSPDHVYGYPLEFFGFKDDLR